MYKLGIDLGGTNIKIVLLNNEGDICGSSIVPTPTEGGRSIEDAICRTSEELFSETGIDNSVVEKAGIAVPGVVKPPRGPVLLAPNVGWANYDPLTYLEEKLHIPFVIGNDADCMAMAESAKGSGRQFESFVMLTLGTGVGGAIVNNGKLFTGFTSYGGELGHIPLVHGGHPCNCKQNGCLEQYASATALKRLTLELTGRSLDPVELFEEVNAGNEDAIQVLDTYVEYLCEGITGFINVLRPHGIILGGGITGAGAPLFDRINKVLPTMAYCSELIPVPPVVAAELGMFSGAQGAAFL